MRNPTNGELKIMFDNLSEKQDVNHHETMEILKEVRDDGKATKEQATKTNGRVSKLEFWKSAIIWVIGALFAAIGAMFPILRAVVTHEIERTVKDSVQTALLDYDKIEIIH